VRLGRLLIAGIMQHIEEAGIHSGDSSCVLPAVGIRPQTLDVLRTYTRRLALALKVIGLVNLQFAIQRDAEGKDHVFVIEVNRAPPVRFRMSRRPLEFLWPRCCAADDGPQTADLLPEQLASGKDLDTGTYYYVKSPVFPWSNSPEWIQYWGRR